MLRRLIILPVLLALLTATALGFAQDDPLELTETHEFTGFGFSIDYPAGWLANTTLTITSINENEDDHQAAMRGADPLLMGVAVTLDHRGPAFLQSIGLPADATVEDLLAFNFENFDYEQVSPPEEAEVFGVVGLRVRVNNPQGDTGIVYQGFVGEEAFLLILGAPDAETLDAFMPTWEAMLASITAVEEVEQSEREPVLVDVGGYSVSLTCRGEGTPSVIFVSGLAGDAESWQAGDVLGEVSQTTQACAYDRRGLGESDPLPEERRTAQASADELTALLANAQIDGPYVLVAHSYGGFIARLFANDNPDDVVGMVLVDASSEHQEARAREVVTEDERQMLAREFENANERNPENVDLVLSIEQVMASEGLGDIPLVVLTAGLAGDAPPQISEASFTALHDVWVNELQVAFLELSTNSTQVIVEDSGHFIPIEQPQAVIDATLDVLMSAMQDQ